MGFPGPGAKGIMTLCYLWARATGSPHLATTSAVDALRTTTRLPHRSAYARSARSQSTPTSSVKLPFTTLSLGTEGNPLNLYLTPS